MIWFLHYNWRYRRYSDSKNIFLNTGPRFNIKTDFFLGGGGIGILIIKITRSWDRLIFRIRKCSPGNTSFSLWNNPRIPQHLNWCHLTFINLPLQSREWPPHLPSPPHAHPARHVGETKYFSNQTTKLKHLIGEYLAANLHNILFYTIWGILPNCPRTVVAQLLMCHMQTCWSDWYLEHLLRNSPQVTVTRSHQYDKLVSDNGLVSSG